MKQIINILIFILFVLSSLSFYFTREIEFLFALTSEWWFFLELFIFPVFLFLFLSRLKSNIKWLEKVENRLFILCSVALFILYLSSRHQDKFDWNYIDTTGGVITCGIVKEIKISYSSGNITVEYKKKDLEQIEEVWLPGNSAYAKKNSVGDTVLLLHSLDYSIHFFYDRHPTHEKIQQCKNGCYYINGKIVDSLDN